MVAELLGSMDFENDYEPNDDYESYAMRQRIQPHGGQLMMTTQVTTKVPPGFDGKTSWFAFEDAIDDWCDITELESEKWGPALRNRLEGEASVYKRLLDRDELRQPHGRGVDYLKRTLRPHFVKGAQTVFIYRFMKFMKNNRGNGDLMKWMTRFQIDGRRLEEAWMDLLQDLDLMSPAIQNEVLIQRQRHDAAQRALVAADNNHVVEPWTDEMEQAIFDEAIRLHKQAHRDLFPLSPNLIALIFISTADLSQDQRQSLTSIMTHRNRRMDEYRVGELREVFIELFCTVRTAVDNPMMNPSGSGGRRAFLALEEGELEGNFGYWAEDEEDGAEGFLDALEDVFWIWDDSDCSWYQRRFQGRRIRKGKGKGRKGKGKGKGRQGRRFFRPRNKGKGKGKRKGKSHLAGDESYLASDEWQGYETENWNEGYWAYEDETAWQSQAWDEWQEDYYDEYGYFQGKGKKGKKGKGKGKKGHGPQDQGKGQSDGKGEANYVNPSPSTQPALQQAALPSSANASGFFVTPSMDLTSVEMIEVAEQRMEPEFSGSAFLGQEPDPVKKVEEEGMAFHTENQMPPTVAILDLGCSTLLYFALLYFALLYSTLLYSTLLYSYSTLLDSTLLYLTLLYSTLLLHYSTLLYSTTLYSTLLYLSTLSLYSISLLYSTPTLPHSYSTPLLLYYSLLYPTLPYSTLLYSTLLFSTLLYSTLLCSALLCSALLYSTLLYSYSTLPYSTLHYSTLLYSALLCSTLLYSTLLYG